MPLYVLSMLHVYKSSIPWCLIRKGSNSQSNIKQSFLNFLSFWTVITRCNFHRYFWENFFLVFSKFLQLFMGVGFLYGRLSFFLACKNFFPKLRTLGTTMVFLVVSRGGWASSWLLAIFVGGYGVVDHLWGGKQRCWWSSIPVWLLGIGLLLVGFSRWLASVAVKKFGVVVW